MAKKDNQRGRKNISVAARVREEAQKIVAEKGEISLGALLREIAARIKRKGITMRTDFAISSIASTPGLRLSVTAATKERRVKIVSK
jgi:hypothetical protein